MIETVISIQPRISSSGGTGKSNDEIVMDLAKDLEFRLPQLLDRSAGNPDLFKLTDVGSLPSLSTVLLQEVIIFIPFLILITMGHMKIKYILNIQIEKFNKLLGVCKESLGNLQKAIKGFVVMS